MAHDDDKSNKSNTDTPDTSLSTPTSLSEPQTQNVISESAVITPTSQPENRTELVERARLFLTSPQIGHEDVSAKRKFLVEKGLNDAEIDGLLRELPAQVPLVPPRTYPQPPPSNLLNLLIGLARIFSWMVGGSAALIFIYYRYLLPFLTHSYQARLSLRLHQKGLLSRLTTSIVSLKQTQSETFSVLPKPTLPMLKEEFKYKNCHALDQIISASNEKPQEVSPLSVLRCAIEELAAQGRALDSEELFQFLETKFPWLNSEEGAKYKNDLWKTLSTHPLFKLKDNSPKSTWSYIAPTPQDPTPLLSSLFTLRATFPKRQPWAIPFQHTLQTLSDLTGYLTTQIYTLPNISSYRAPGIGAGTTLGPEEEELRREIRSMKGLVLNRRSFLSGVPRSTSTPTGADKSITP